MNHDEFLHAFETAELNEFPHRSHLRMAWIYLRRDGWETGFEHIQSGIQHFAAAKGASTKYHETITRFWAYLMYWVITHAPADADFDHLIEAHAHLLDTAIIKKHYSTARLSSNAARRTWVEPDLIPLPAQKLSD